MAYVIEQKIVNDVTAPRWLVGQDGAFVHAFLVPDGEVTADSLPAVCGETVPSGDAPGAEGGKRCPGCVRELAEDTRKAGKALSERQTAPTGTGSQVGDPSEGERRRSVEIDGAFARGTVEIPVKGEKGRTKLTEAPATEENLRKALGYWKGRKPRTDASRAAQSEQVSSLVRRLAAMGGHKTPVFRSASAVPAEGVDTPIFGTGTYATDTRRVGTAAMTARTSPEGFTQHVLPGPAIVQGPNMEAERPTRTNPKTGEVEYASARLDGSLAERLDRTVADDRPRAHWTKSQRKNWRRKNQRRELAAAKARIKVLEAEVKRARA